MKYTWLHFLDYNLVKDYETLFPRLQSNKKERIMHCPTNQNLDLGARLQTGKVLGTYSARTESGLLDSK